VANFLAVDADAHGLFVAAGTVRNGAVTIDRTAHAADAPPLSAATAADLGATLRMLVKDAGLRAAPVLLCVGRDRVILKDVRHPPAPPAEEPAIVRFQALRDLSESPDDVVMDYVPLPPLSSGERRAAVVFARKDVVETARAVCEAAGLRLAAVTPRPFVVGDLFRRVDAARTADGANGLLAVWPGGGELTVVRGRDVLFARAISQASALDDKALVAELKRNLAVYAGQFPADPLAGLAVAAGGDLADRLADALTVPVRPLDPLAGSAAADGVTAGLHGRFAGPVGLLAAKAAADALPINFAAPRQPRADANPNRPRVLVGAMLATAAVAAAVVGGVVLNSAAANERASAAADRAAVEAEMKALEVSGKRLDAAEEFANREVVWLDELYDVAHRIPDVGQVRLTLLEGTAVAPPAKSNLMRAGSQTPATAAKGPAGPPKPVPVGKLHLEMTTDKPALVDEINASFSRDRYYVNTKPKVTLTGATGSRGQKFVIETEVLRRPPDEYKRVLKSLPKPAAPAAPAAGFDPDLEEGGE
jgi:hypothetical protein